MYFVHCFMVQTAKIIVKKGELKVKFKTNLFMIKIVIERIEDQKRQY